MLKVFATRLLGFGRLTSAVVFTLGSLCFGVFLELFEDVCQLLLDETSPSLSVSRTS